MSIQSKRTMAKPSSANSPIGSDLSFAAQEAYKLLRANLLFSLPAKENKCRVVGITSSIPSEGKSTTSINLAYSIAEAGKKVLLIEGDMRLPTHAKRLNLERSPGLSNLLAGLCTGTEALRKSGLHENLHVMLAGDIPPNPSELLASERMASIVESLSNGYDYIVFDLPPITVVSDGLVLAKLFDGLILVVRRDYCTRQVLDEAMRQLEFQKVKVLGFVFTRSEVLKKSYKKYKYKKGYSYSYGSKSYADASKSSSAKTGSSKKSSSKSDGIVKVEGND